MSSLPFLHPIYNKSYGLTPLLEVCYEVAEYAHRGVPRTKKTGDIAYITHPTIVYKLLRLVGIDDEITLAACFLHDVMEDCPEFKKPEALRARLAKGFKQANLPDADKFAYLIVELCEELTNAEHMAEGKRGWQWEHGQRLSPRAKLVKIADQAASLVDDILLPSDRSYEQMRKFNMKALECAKACAGENELLDHLFKVLFRDAMTVMDGEQTGAPPDKAADAERIRENFSLEEALRAAEQYPPAKEDAPPVKWRRHPQMSAAKTGITSIGITEDDKVCRFAMLVDPDKEADSSCNKPVMALIQNLEAVSPTRVTYQPLEILDGRVVRSFKLKPPLALAEFIEKAVKSSAIEASFASRASAGIAGRSINN